MTEIQRYRRSQRDHADTFTEYHANLARQTTDRDQARRHRRIAGRWARAALAWG